MKIFFKDMHFFKMLVIYLQGILLLSGCSLATELNENKLPVPDRVYDVKEYDLKKESAYQIDYKIDIPYPDLRVLDYYKEYLNGKKWGVCEGGNTWENFHKLLDDEGVYLPTRQYLSYFTSSEDERLIALTLRYYGSKLADISNKTEWDDNTQFVTAVVYDLESNTYKKTLSALSLKCP